MKELDYFEVLKEKNSTLPVVLTQNHFASLLQNKKEMFDELLKAEDGEVYLMDPDTLIIGKSSISTPLSLSPELSETKTYQEINGELKIIEKSASEHHTAEKEKENTVSESEKPSPMEINETPKCHLSEKTLLHIIESQKSISPSLSKANNTCSEITPSPHNPNPSSSPPTPSALSTIPPTTTATSNLFEPKNTKNTKNTEYINCLELRNSSIPTPPNPLFSLKQQTEDTIPPPSNTYFLQQITNIQQIRFKSLNHYYLTFNAFLNDLYSLFKTCFQGIGFHSSSSQSHSSSQHAACLYFNHLLVQTVMHAVSFRKLFKKLRKNDFQTLFNNNIELRMKTWNKEGVSNRQYFQIEEFLSGVEEKEEGIRVLQRLKSRLRGNCDGEHCLQFQNLGPLDLVKDTWNSLCEDRRKKIECDRASCGCWDKQCKNRAISDKNSKSSTGNLYFFSSLNWNLGDNPDVKEIISWGIDVYTAKNILHILPKNISIENKYKFIESLSFAFSKQVD